MKIKWRMREEEGAGKGDDHCDDREQSLANLWEEKSKWMQSER